MLDVKAWDGFEHYRLTGEFNDTVLKNLRWLAEQGKLTEVRTVVVPELFDCEATIRNVCAVLRETESLSTRYKIICYRPNGVRQQYRHLKSPSVDTLQGLADIAAEYGLKDVVTV
jgi:pyruvate formate lyase activating enzyme